MKNFNRLFIIYSQLEPQEPDPQVMMQCDACVYVPLETVLSQFKYLVQKKKEEEHTYNIFRRYLESVFDKQTVDDLEAM